MTEHITALQASVSHVLGLASDFFLYERWEGPWFEKDNWERLMKGLRVTLTTAGALFLSPKTVEYHLRHVYTKLGITNRSELADLVASGG